MKERKKYGRSCLWITILAAVFLPMTIWGAAGSPAEDITARETEMQTEVQTEVQTEMQPEVQSGLQITFEGADSQTYYNRDVELQVYVTETDHLELSENCGGICQVSYEVVNPELPEEEQITQSGILFQRPDEDSADTSEQSEKDSADEGMEDIVEDRCETDAVLDFQGQIRVEASENSCDHIEVNVTAVDCQGISHTETMTLRFDTDSPTVIMQAFGKDSASALDPGEIADEDVVISCNVSDEGGSVSGIRWVTYQIQNQGEITGSGVLCNGETDAVLTGAAEQTQEWIYPEAMSGEITVDSETNNSNDVVVWVTAMDLSGNQTTQKQNLKIDITKPEINITFDQNNPDNGLYYNEDRTAVIEVAERNFDPENVRFALSGSDGNAPEISDWETIGGSGNNDDLIHRATVTWEKDGIYTFDISCTDAAGNSSDGKSYAYGTSSPDLFVIDKTKPVVSLSYDNNDVQNGSYFNAPRTAVLRITEANFDADCVVLEEQAAVLDGQTIDFPEITWTEDGDVHIAEITFSEDGTYHFVPEVTDLAGNVCDCMEYGQSEAPEQFAIDQREVELVDVLPADLNGSAVTDETGKISLAIRDRNLASYEIHLYRSRVLMDDTDNEKVIMQGVENRDDVTDQFLGQASGTESAELSFTIPKYDSEKQSNDGFYQLVITAVDLAGNTLPENQRTILFSVNRFGSVYCLGDTISDLAADGGQYVQYSDIADEDLLLYEFNPTPLTEEPEVTITRDAGPQLVTLRTDSVLSTMRHDAGNPMSWYEYTYNLAPENFEKDGIYKVSVSSIDTSKHHSETLTYDSMEIRFFVDSTAPELVAILGLDEEIYYQREHPVEIELTDAIGLKQVSVEIDGEEADLTPSEENSSTDYKGTFYIKQSDQRQHVRIIAVDRAGNRYISDRDVSEGTGFTSDVTVENPVQGVIHHVAEQVAGEENHGKKSLIFLILLGCAAAVSGRVLIHRIRKTGKSRH